MPSQVCARTASGTLAVMLFSILSHGQLNIQWRANNGSSDASVSTMFAASDGSVYLVGSSRGEGMFASHLSQDGQLQWSNTFNDPVYGRGTTYYDCDLSRQGRLYVCGIFENWYSSNFSDGALVTFRSDGSTEWWLSYDSSGHINDGFNAVLGNEDGSVLVAGGSGTFGGPPSWFLLKYGTNGSQDWFKLVSLPPYAEPYRLFHVGNEYLLVGYAYHPIGSDPHGRRYFFLSRFSPSGDLLWTITYDPPDIVEQWLDAVTMDEKGNIYMMPVQWKVIIYHGDRYLVFKFSVVKFSPDGRLLWERSDFTEPHSGGMVVDDANGAVYVTPTNTRSLQSLDTITDMHLVRLDAASGDTVWEAPLKVPSTPYAGLVRLMKDRYGDIYVATMGGREVQGPENYYITDLKLHMEKLTPHGQTRWNTMLEPYWPSARRPLTATAPDNSLLMAGNTETWKLHVSAIRSEGDVTWDGCVDDDDLIELILSFALDTLDADVTGDGRVDDDDLMVMLDYWLLGCGE